MASETVCTSQRIAEGHFHTGARRFHAGHIIATNAGRGTLQAFLGMTVQKVTTKVYNI